MSKLFTVARQEYLRSVRSKAFIIGVLVMPLLMGAGIIVVGLTEAIEDTDDHRFAVVDRTGVLYGTIEQATNEYNANAIWDSDEPGKQVRSRFEGEETTLGDDDEGLGDLVSRARDGDLLGYLVIGADIGDPEGADCELAWFTNKPTYGDLRRWLQEVVNNALRGRRISEAGLDESFVVSLTRSDRVREMGLPKVDSDGAITAAEEVDDVASMVIPIVLAMLIYMLVMMAAPALLNNVLEEKMQKISEVLVSSVSPFQLLMGKLFSSVLVALTLSVLYLGAGLVFVHNVDGVPPAVLDALRPEILGWFLVFLVIGLVIYGSMFSALGAACSELQDAQTMMMPAMVLVMIPLLFLGVVMETPDSAIARGLSFFPPATPILMLLRVCIPPGVAQWELWLAVLTTALFACLCVWVGSKIFRIGVLAQGQTPSYRKLLSWVLSK